MKCVLFLLLLLKSNGFLVHEKEFVWKMLIQIWQNIFATTRLWIYYVKATAWAVPPSAFLFYNLNLKACTGKMQYWKLKRHPSLSIRSTKRTLPVKNAHKLLTFLSLPLFWQGCLLCITITRASATNRPWLRGLIFTHHSPISLCKCFLQD